MNKNSKKKKENKLIIRRLKVLKENDKKEKRQWYREIWTDTSAELFIASFKARTQLSTFAYWVALCHPDKAPDSLIISLCLIGKTRILSHLSFFPLYLTNHGFVITCLGKEEEEEEEGIKRRQWKM